MPLDMDIGFATEAGRKPVNEDFCGAMLAPPERADRGCILAIADGVSAGGRGREAAQTSIASVLRDYYATPETWDTSVALDRIIRAQNAWLEGINRRRPDAVGLSTLTALVLRGHSYTLAHVGDTRAYLLRDARLHQLTQDHSARSPDLRHQLLRALGLESHVVVDSIQDELRAGDRFVLLSDGVHAALGAAALARLLLRWAAPESTQTAQAAAQQLVESALAAGSPDNATALLVQVRTVQLRTLADYQRTAQALPVPRRLRVGEVLDDYRVTALVADNGVHLLYQVRDLHTGALWALKTLHPARAHDAQERTMLAHEAWLAHRVQTGAARQHFVALREAPAAAAPASHYYLVYRWHAGATLQQLLQQGHAFDVAQVVNLALQLSTALGHLHRQCIVHRDIKPANLHRGDDGVLRVLDFGVALSGRASRSQRELHAGTPSYINPEQWERVDGRSDGTAQAANAQSDLFALGVTLYQLLTRKLPYGEVLPYQSGRYFRDPPAPSRSNPQVPIWLDHVVCKAVARQQKDRFETAEELMLALERGAARPLTMAPHKALLERSAYAGWKLALGLSLLLNALLLYWLLFLPR